MVCRPIRFRKPNPIRWNPTPYINVSKPFVVRHSAICGHGLRPRNSCYLRRNATKLYADDNYWHPKQNSKYGFIAAYKLAIIFFNATWRAAADNFSGFYGRQFELMAGCVDASVNFLIGNFTFCSARPVINFTYYKVFCKGVITLSYYVQNIHGRASHRYDISQSKEYQ